MKEIEIIKNEDETRSLKLHPIGEKYENYVREVTHDYFSDGYIK